MSCTEKASESSIRRSPPRGSSPCESRIHTLHISAHNSQIGSFCRVATRISASCNHRHFHEESKSFSENQLSNVSEILVFSVGVAGLADLQGCGPKREPKPKPSGKSRPAPAEMRFICCKSFVASLHQILNLVLSVHDSRSGAAMVVEE